VSFRQTYGLRENIALPFGNARFHSAALSYTFGLRCCVLYRFNFLSLFTCAALLQKRYCILYHLSCLLLFTFTKALIYALMFICAYGTSGLCPHPLKGYSPLRILGRVENPALSASRRLLSFLNCSALLTDYLLPVLFSFHYPLSSKKRFFCYVFIFFFFIAL